MITSGQQNTKKLTFLLNYTKLGENQLYRPNGKWKKSNTHDISEELDSSSKSTGFMTLFELKLLGKKILRKWVPASLT